MSDGGAIRLTTRRPSSMTSACGGCGTQLAPSLLACPACGALAHADQLNALAQRAESAERNGDLSAGAAAWRRALELMPPSAPQHAVVAARLDDVSRRLRAAPALASGQQGAGADGKKRGWRAAGGGILVVLLSKAKLLLLGLTKLKTLLSMLAFVGVYWGLYGWPLAVGFVVSIYIHEMGHVAALAHLGIRASAPMFIPGFGAFVELEQPLRSSREDAIVGLAGPLWGLGAAVAAYAVYLASGAPIWGAIASLGAWVNLFNLMPVWQLDGSRGFAALSRPQRWMACLAAAGAALLAQQPILWVVAAVGAWRALQENHEAGDDRALFTYVGLVAALSTVWLATLPVAGVR